MLKIADSDIGGGRVRRTFTRNGEQLKAGVMLSAEEILSIAIPNREALVDSNFLELYPKSSKGERFLVQVAKGEYNVIEGRIVNKSPVTREVADRMLHE